MRRLFLIASVMVFAATGAFAQTGSLAVAGDLSGADCNLADIPGLCTYYIVHLSAPGATAAQFSAPQPGCMTAALWLSDTPVFPVTIGNSQSGVAVGYGECLTSPITVLSINFFCQGLTGPCCYYQVLPDPNGPSGTIEMVDCDNQLLTGVGGIEGIFNSGPGCDCAVGVEASTWGKVKSLYSE